MKRPRKKRVIGGRTYSLYENCSSGRGSHWRAAWKASEARVPGRSVKVVKERKRWCVYVCKVERSRMGRLRRPAHA